MSSTPDTRTHGRPGIRRKRVGVKSRKLTAGTSRPASMTRSPSPQPDARQVPHTNPGATTSANWLADTTVTNCAVIPETITNIAAAKFTYARKLPVHLSIPSWGHDPPLPATRRSASSLA